MFIDWAWMRIGIEIVRVVESRVIKACRELSGISVHRAAKLKELGEARSKQEHLISTPLARFFFRTLPIETVTQIPRGKSTAFQALFITTLAPFLCACLKSLTSSISYMIPTFRFHPPFLLHLPTTSSYIYDFHQL